MRQRSLVGVVADRDVGRQRLGDEIEHGLLRRGQEHLVDRRLRAERTPGRHAVDCVRAATAGARRHELRHLAQLGRIDQPGVGRSSISARRRCRNAARCHNDVLLTRTGTPESAHRGSPRCSSTWTRRASPCGRSRRCTARPSSARCSSTTSLVPFDRTLGDEGQGWAVAMDLLPVRAQHRAVAPRRVPAPPARSSCSTRRRAGRARSGASSAR